MFPSKFLQAALVTTTIVCIAGSSAMAGDYAIENPRARPSLGVAKNTAVFLTIHNNTSQSDKLISAQSTVADKVQLHTHLKENGVFKMRPVKSIPLPANGSAVLKSGGFHIMIIGVKSKLKVGDAFEVKLNFENSKSITVKVPVLKLGGMKMDHKKMPEMKKKNTE